MSKSGGVFQIDDVTRAMSKGGGACECPRVGAFFKLMTSRGQCPRGGGGAPRVPPIQVQKFRPPPTWLAGYGPADTSDSSSDLEFGGVEPQGWRLIAASNIHLIRNYETFHARMLSADVIQAVSSI